MKTPKVEGKRNPSKLKMERLQAFLKTGAYDLNEIAQHMHIVRRTASRYINTLLDPANKRVYIAGYRYESIEGRTDYPRELYKWGKGKDAPRPRAMTVSERGKRRRQELMKDLEWREAHKKRCKAYRLKKRAPKQDDLLNLFFGRTSETQTLQDDVRNT